MPELSRHSAPVLNAYVLYDSLSLIVAGSGILEDQAAYLDVELLRIGQVVDPVECLILPGRLDDERAETE